MTALDERGEPVGFLCMTKADYEKNSIHFCYIIVSSKSRGKGYGTQMLRSRCGMLRNCCKCSALPCGCLKIIRQPGIATKKWAFGKKPITRWLWNIKGRGGQPMIWSIRCLDVPFDKIVFACAAKCICC